MSILDPIAVLKRCTTMIGCAHCEHDNNYDKCTLNRINEAFHMFRVFKLTNIESVHAYCKALKSYRREK